VLKRLTIMLGLSVTALAVGLGALAPPILTQARDLVFDAYQRASPRAYDPAAPVHIIDIDEAALDAYGQWPWPRSYMAALTDRLFDHGAAAVGYDILFAEPDRTSPERIAESWSRFREGIPPVLPDLGLPPHDQVFAAAIEGRPVVLSVAGGQEGEVPVPRAGVAVTGAVPPGLTQYPAAVVNLPELTAAAAGLGTISLGRSARRGDAHGAAGQRGGRDADARALGGAVARGAGAGGHILRTTEGSGEVSGGTVAAVAMRTGALSYPGGGRRCVPHPFRGPSGGARHPAAQVLEAEASTPRFRRAWRGASCWWGPPRRGSSTSAPRRSTRPSRA
jgi:adenylate cyclase